jgi:hypothetical protein
MANIDSFGEYVRDRLEEWGREFALHRDCEYLGHQSVNMLQVLIDHKGEMPPRPTGFKPLEVSLMALQIERLVSEIARDQVLLACALRAHYCGSGRRKVERYETALLLMAYTGNGREYVKLPNLRQYLGMVEDGRTMIRGALVGMAMAA